MAAIIINTTKAVVFALVAVSAIVSLYAATNAVAVYTDADVFVSGIASIMTGVLLGPLFCFVAAYGLVYYLDVPMMTAVAIVAPTLAGWCVAAARALGGLAARG